MLTAKGLAMTGAVLPATEAQTLEALVHGIDHALEAHLAWGQGLLRCALLHESPGDEVLRPDAHSICPFGLWFASHRYELDTFDEALVERMEKAHRCMHDAVRLMCQRVMQGLPAAAADLHAYEQAQSTMVVLINELRERVAEASTHQDTLTGLPLRHGLDYAFGLRCKDARRDEAQLWLAMVDVDHFKSVNDRHGHAAGDVALQHIARCLVGCLRESDALFRFGGEEFLALFLVHEAQGIELLAARLLEAVSAEPLSIATGATLQLSVTVGLACVREGEDLASATERADLAMLLGKAQGRARFVLAPD
jgi:diguanylate cyclase (GGDEF)-like protein